MNAPAPSIAIYVSQNSTINGAIVNNGSLSGSRGAIEAAGLITDGIFNNATISAGADGAGISVSSARLFGSTSAAGEISNSGVITAGFGISAEFIQTFAGNIGNSGTINAALSLSGEMGIQLFLASFDGAIVNSAGGVITANSAWIFAGVAHGTGSITNAGTISDAFYGIKVDNTATFTGDILNTGSILDFFGIQVVSAEVFNGNIINAAGATINAFGSERSGIALGTETRVDMPEGVPSFNGNIVNSGTISAGSGVVVLDTTVTGSITNAGKIAVGYTGIAVVSGGRVSSIVNGAGGNEANLTLLGQYTAASFTSASDGHGGTLIADPPPEQQAQIQITTPHG